MKNIRFLWNNLWDDPDHTVTSSSEETGYEDVHTYHRWHTRAWRTTDDASEWIKIDFGEAKSVQALVLHYHNLTSGATIKLQGNATDSWGSPSVDETVTYNARTIHHFLSASESYRWWRISLVDDSNPDTYLRIGRIFLGPYFEPTANFTDAHRYTLADPSGKAYSSGGQVSSNLKSHFRKFSYEFQFIQSPEEENFEEIFDEVGQSKPYFIAQDADSGASKTYYVENRTDWNIDHIFMDDWFSLNIDVEEMR